MNLSLLDDKLKHIGHGIHDSNQIYELRDKVEHHAEVEESELFPQAEALLGEQELLRLGQKIQAMKVGRSVAAWYRQ